MASPGVSASRAGAMAVRLAETAERLGIDLAGRDLIGAAFDLATARRLGAGLAEHDPDFLHPARTGLILMDDAGVADAPALAAALLAESRDPELRPAPQTVRELGEEVADLVAALPDPDPVEGLLERLVTAGPTALLIAVAERLDHARHLHLRPRAEWAAYHATTCAAYASAAARAHPTLHRRLAWWCRTFARRFLRTG